MLPRLLSVVGIAALVTACAEPKHIEPGLKVRPGLWKTVSIARVAAEDPHIRAMPTPGEICVGPDGKGWIPFVEDNGDECTLVDLRRTDNGWAGRSTCRLPEGRKLQVNGWVRGDLVNAYTVVGRIGEDGMVLDIVATWAGPCPPGRHVGPAAKTDFR